MTAPGPEPASDPQEVTPPPQRAAGKGDGQTVLPNRRPGAEGRDLRLKRRSRGGSALRETAIIVVTALVLSLLIKTFLVQAFFIPSQSMEQTLRIGDRVMVSKLTPSPFAVRRGDVVVFSDDDHWLPPSVPVDQGPVGNALHSALTFIGLLPTDLEGHLIKRVIGLPGDHVACCDAKGRVTVNGFALDEPYLYPGDVPSQTPFAVTVPAGRLWVMGDHRSQSADSREHQNQPGGGSIPLSSVTGRAVLLVWPLDHLQWLENPGGTFDRVPAPTR